MWRAFSRANARVALVLRIPLDEGSAPPLRLLFSPVAYFTEAQLSSQIDILIANLERDRVYLASIAPKILKEITFATLVVAALCLKHEGFLEEREWRAIYMPARYPSAMLPASTVSIDGVPQIIHKIPLTGENELNDFDIPHLIDRIIIGPTQYPWVIYEAFVDALRKAGVSDADKHVFMSEIPIRT